MGGLLGGQTKWLAKVGVKTLYTSPAPLGEQLQKLKKLHDELLNTEIFTFVKPKR